jgi:hypothetical protein
MDSRGRPRNGEEKEDGDSRSEGETHAPGCPISITHSVAKCYRIVERGELAIDLAFFPARVRDKASRRGPLPATQAAMRYREPDPWRIGLVRFRKGVKEATETEQ